MNFLNLYYFSIAAEELNFTKAAKRLFISQQSLEQPHFQAGIGIWRGVI